MSGGNGKVFATTGYGIIVAYDAKTDAEVWKKTFKEPLRGTSNVAPFPGQ